MSKFFKMIPGYEDYLVSENGDIFSKKSNKLLKPKKNRFGYKYVILYKNGKPKTFSIHRLVAMTHLNNPNNYPVINHKDGNKSNNQVENLEWCTASQNVKHAWKLGLKENTRAAVRQNCKNVGKIYGKIYGKINGKIYGKINVKFATEANIRHLDDNLQNLFDDIFINKLKNKDICQKYNLKPSYVSQIKNKQRLQTALDEYFNNK